MAVNVHISLLAAEKDTEQLAAQELKKNFEYYFSNIYPEAEGDVYILHNVSVFGQLVRDIDLVVFANLKNYILNNVVTRSHGEVESLHIDNFVCNIELKDHTHDYIEHEGTSYFVTYPTTRERKNATKQAHEQLHALRNYMHELSNIKSWVCDMVWFRSVSLEALNGIRRNRQDNALHSDFTFEDLARMFSQRSNVNEQYDGFHLGGRYIDVEDNKKMVNLLCTPREPEGLSRKRFELISQEIDPNQFIREQRDRFTIIKGRAGTGKTIILLQLAFYYANEENKRSLLITYNNALVSDIKRLIDFAYTQKSGKNVDIKTADSFFLNILWDNNIVSKDLTPMTANYKEQYINGLNKLNELLKQNDSSDIVKPNLDYIFIDEGQDWDEVCRDILFKLYGPSHIIVADGVDQFITSNNRLIWDQNMTKKNSSELSTGLRQKANLVRFVNSYAKKVGLDWRVDPCNSLPGGRVIIRHDYGEKAHNSIVDKSIEDGCSKYDILFLAPPSYVNDKGEFKMLNAYKSAKIDLFDGIDPNNRNKYPVLEKSRIYQYDSCRGLEGWAVICLDFDLLIEYKENTIDTSNFIGLDIESYKKQMAHLWSLMPLTRAIDTLVILLKDLESPIAKTLKEISKENPDFIEWHID